MIEDTKQPGPSALAVEAADKLPIYIAFNTTSSDAKRDAAKVIQSAIDRATAPLAQEVERLCEEVHKANRLIQQSDEQQDQLRADLAILRDETDSLRYQTKRLRCDCDSMRAKLEEEKARVAMLTSDYAEDVAGETETEELEQLKQYCGECNKRVHELQDQLEQEKAKACPHCQKAVQTIGRLQRGIDNQRETLSGLHNDLHQITQALWPGAKVGLAACRIVEGIQALQNETKLAGDMLAAACKRVDELHTERDQRRTDILAKWGYNEDSLPPSHNDWIKTTDEANALLQERDQQRQEISALRKCVADVSDLDNTKLALEAVRKENSKLGSLMNDKSQDLSESRCEALRLRTSNAQLSAQVEMMRRLLRDIPHDLPSRMDWNDMRSAALSTPPSDALRQWVPVAVLRNLMPFVFGEYTMPKPPRTEYYSAVDAAKAALAAAGDQV